MLTLTLSFYQMQPSKNMVCVGVNRTQPQIDVLGMSFNQMELCSMAGKIWTITNYSESFPVRQYAKHRIR